MPRSNKKTQKNSKRRVRASRKHSVLQFDACPELPMFTTRRMTENEDGSRAGPILSRSRFANAASENKSIIDPKNSLGAEAARLDRQKRIDETLEVYHAVRILDKIGQKITALFRESHRPGQSIPADGTLAQFIRSRVTGELEEFTVVGKDELIEAFSAELHQELSELARSHDEQIHADRNHQDQIARAGPLPTEAPRRYHGISVDGDPLQFLLAHYGRWLDAGLLDRPMLRRYDMRLWYALSNSLGRHDPVRLRSVFPSSAEARRLRAKLFLSQQGSRPMEMRWDPTLEEQRAHWRNAKRARRRR